MKCYFVNFWKILYPQTAFFSLGSLENDVNREYYRVADILGGRY